jgi:hypothetical protein
VITAEQVAEHLRTAVVASASRISKGTLPSSPGLYAWWTSIPLDPKVAAPPSGLTVRAPGLDLIYVGISRNLDARVWGDHLGAATGSSTLRRALGAWSGPSAGWVTEHRGGRVQHTPASEAVLTAWMRDGLSVSWVEHESPADVERDVIQILRPPLNWQHNRAHPNWAELDSARAVARRPLTSAESGLAAGFSVASGAEPGPKRIVQRVDRARMVSRSTPAQEHPL